MPSWRVTVQPVGGQQPAQSPQQPYPPPSPKSKRTLGGWIATLALVAAVIVFAFIFLVPRPSGQYMLAQGSNGQTTGQVYCMSGVPQVQVYISWVGEVSAAPTSAIATIHVWWQGTDYGTYTVPLHGAGGTGGAYGVNLTGTCSVGGIQQQEATLLLLSVTVIQQ